MESTDKHIHPDSSEEKKTNRNLAIGIGVSGVVLFGLFYVLFFAVMFLQPGMMFKLMPSISITDAAISDGSKTYLLLQKVDMSRVNPREKNQQPQIKHFLSVLNGTEQGPAQEIPSYAKAFGSSGRLVFLRMGGYRIFDGVNWVDEKMDAIGKDPQGLLAPDGLYVLSRSGTGPRLNRIVFKSAVDVPLPADYLAGNKKDQCCCTKLALYQGHLCLFWTTNGSIAWSILNGTAWTPAAVSPFAGGFDVVSDDRNLYFFHREGEGFDQSLRYYVFTNDVWSKPIPLSIPDAFMKWDVFIQQGKLRLFVQQFPSQTLYTIEKNALVDPIRFAGPFNPARMIGQMAFFILLGNALTFLFVFAVSAFIRKFKKRFITADGRDYEFASLFRRFLATMIDNIVILLPPAVILAFYMPSLKTISGNPFLFMFVILCTVVFYFIGGFLYHSLLEGFYGQTLGKKICGIQVLKTDFSPCGLSAGFLRNLLRIADAFFYYLVAVIALAGTFKWQRVGDLVADTVVVRKSG